MLGVSCPVLCAMGQRMHDGIPRTEVMIDDMKSREVMMTLILGIDIRRCCFFSLFFFFNFPLCYVVEPIICQRRAGGGSPCTRNHPDAIAAFFAPSRALERVHARFVLCAPKTTLPTTYRVLGSFRSRAARVRPRKLSLLFFIGGFRLIELRR